MYTPTLDFVNSSDIQHAPVSNQFAGYYPISTFGNTNTDTSSSTATFSDQSSETSPNSSPPIVQESFPATVFPQPTVAMPWMTNDYQQFYNYQQAYQTQMRVAMPQYGLTTLTPVDSVKPIEDAKISPKKPSPIPFSIEDLQIPSEIASSPESIESGDLERQISVEPKHLALWKKFNRLGNEMILTKRGRNLFPKLEFIVKGLEPDNRYLFALQFKHIGTCKYKYSRGEWQSAGKADDNLDAENPVHHSSNIRYPLGKEWMVSDLSFAKVKLTNSVGDNEKSIISLRSMHKYRPVVVILRWSGTGFQRIDKEIEIADFIAVTSYQNNAVTSLKIGNNPFAKGFRTERTTRRLQPSASLAPSLGAQNAMYMPYSIGSNPMQQNILPYGLFSPFPSVPYYMQGSMPL